MISSFNIRGLWSVIAILFAFTFAFTPMEAEAKKFGGGKSFGKLFKTSPAKKPAADTNKTAQQPAGAQQNNLQKNQANNSKKGMMGGLLGGLLAGGLIAALLGGAFEGIQFMDILIIALIAFVAYRLFKGMAQAKQSSMNRTAYAGSGSAPSSFGQDKFQAPQEFSSNQPESQPTNASFGGSAGRADATPETDEVPLDLPAGFDLDGFLSGACDHYRALQEAWNTSNFDVIEEYTSPKLGQELIAERKSLTGEQHTEVMYVDAEMVRAHQVFGTAQVSIKFSGRYKDSVEGVEEDITDIWHLERDLKEPNAPWFIIGIES